MLIDHHCHLDFPQLEADLTGVIARARDVNVGVLVTISTRIALRARLLAIAEAHEHVYCSLGTHPHNADTELEYQSADIAALADHPKIVAIGEAGLDYYYQKSSREGQAQGFREHIRAARLTGLPLEIHARDADADTAAILRDEHEHGGAFPAVLHCFTGGRELAATALELGLSISFSGVVTFKTGAELLALAAEVPLDRILVETDAPYLAPIPFRGKTNEPSYVVHTAAAIAVARGMPLDRFADATTSNFRRLFTKVPEHAYTRGAGE
ncbi:MAG: TatD family hydrolase [Hyphomicrobiaceae bacterium]